ncbi:reverse transcriptase [Gossypium australe]|uniref:Reverse transcriptase n=1 Tax=Gossypium australe TaxID=47621 RepID=A0A5B6VQA8_9ROSI|nr:reverse transcriptase [Gossypium australe]
MKAKKTFADLFFDFRIALVKMSWRCTCGVTWRSWRLRRWKARETSRDSISYLGWLGFSGLGIGPADVNSKLTTTYLEDEVVTALKEIGPTKASGNDGFPALFFQKYWHIVRRDVNDFCLKVLNEGMDFDMLNMTNIVLISKIPNPTNLVNFKPISICNVLYKLIAKMIVNHFKGVSNACIDKSQSAFVPRRFISNNVLLAYEILLMFR